MTQCILNDLDIHTSLAHPSSEGMPQTVTTEMRKQQGILLTSQHGFIITIANDSAKCFVECSLMIDAIQSSKFLSEAKTRDLIKKLEGMCSKYEAKELNREVIIANRVKSISSSTALFRNVDAIHRAITANAQVSFQYFDFDLKKQKHYMKKGERYVVSPWAMIYTDDNYYLLAYTDGKFKHFRVDHMDNTEAMVTMIADVEIASLEREGAEAFAKLDMSAYTKYTFSMFGGETVPVTMVFQNRMMGAVMDRFGRDVVVMKEDERHFRVTVPVAVSNQFYGWVFGLG